MADDVLALTAIRAPLPDKIEAFKSISATAMSNALPNGWDTVPKAGAACWFADALGVHPIVFMAGAYCATIQGKQQVIPKWELELGLLKSRLPGFTWKVLEENDERATVWVSDGREEHTVTYTLEKAMKQGFLEKNDRGEWKKPAYVTSTEKMLLKQACHAAFDRIGAHILAGMPHGAWDAAEDRHQNSAPAPSGVIGSGSGSVAEVLESEAPTASPGEAGGSEEVPPGGPVPSPVPGAPKRPWAAKVREFLTDSTGKVTRQEILQAVSAAMTAITGGAVQITDLRTFSEADAYRVYLYLLRTRSLLGEEDSAMVSEIQGTTPAGAPVTAAGGRDAQPQPAPDIPDPAPMAVTQDDDGLSWEDFIETVAGAREQTGREIVKEFPPNSKSWWLVEPEIFKQIGAGTSYLLSLDGRAQVMPSMLRTIQRLILQWTDRIAAQKGRA